MCGGKVPLDEMLDHLLPIELPHQTPDRLIRFAPLVAKVTTGSRDGHRGAMGLSYPLRKIVYCPNAARYQHDPSIYLLPNPEVAQRGGFSSYGSHVLVMIPGEYLWFPRENDGRCWHTDLCLPLYCLTCDNYGPGVISLPEFRKDMGLQRLALPPGLKVVGYDPYSQRFVRVSRDGQDMQEAAVRQSLLSALS